MAMDIGELRLLSFKDLRKGKLNWTLPPPMFAPTRRGYPPCSPVPVSRSGGNSAQRHPWRDDVGFRRMQAILGKVHGVYLASRESLAAGHLSGKPTYRPGGWVNQSPLVRIYPAFL